jgi:hypothetical protein
LLFQQTQQKLAQPKCVGDQAEAFVGGVDPTQLAHAARVVQLTQNEFAHLRARTFFDTRRTFEWEAD